MVLANDFLTQSSGADRVFLAMAQAWPVSPILTAVYNPVTPYPEFARHEVRTSPVLRIPTLRRNFQGWFAALPPRLLARRPGGRRVVLSSTTSFAHRIRAAGWLQRLVDDFPGVVQTLRRPGLGPAPLRTLLEKPGRPDVVLPVHAGGGQR